MLFGNVISVIKPDADSHFRLRSCPVCNGDNVAYVEYKKGTQEPWRVDCFDCGHIVDGISVNRHDAQQLWNQQRRSSA